MHRGPGERGRCTAAPRLWSTTSIADRALPMLAQDVVEGFGHQRLEASTLATCERVHCERHFGREEAGDLLAALAAGGAGGSPLPACALAVLGLSGRGLPDRGLAGMARCHRNDGCGDGCRRCAIAQIGERGLAAHAATFPFRAGLVVGVEMPACRHVHS